MSKSLIETIYEKVSLQKVDENPIYSIKVVEKTENFLKAYSNDTNFFDFESDLSEILCEKELCAFTAGFKTAMKFIMEV